MRIRILLKQYCFHLILGRHSILLVTFILAVLKSYGFGPDFIQWLKTLPNAESCHKRGKSTGYFPLQRGKRQGDPLSAYLFILALKVMLFQIRKDDNYQRHNDRKRKLSAYADDIYFFFVKIRAPSSQYLQLVTYLKIFGL